MIWVHLERRISSTNDERDELGVYPAEDEDDDVVVDSDFELPIPIGVGEGGSAAEGD